MLRDIGYDDAQIAEMAGGPRQEPSLRITTTTSAPRTWRRPRCLGTGRLRRRSNNEPLPSYDLEEIGAAEAMSSPGYDVTVERTSHAATR